MHYMLPVLLLKKVLFPVVVLLMFAQLNVEKLKGDNEDENTGIAIIRRALEEPLRQIVANCRYIDGSVVIQKVKEGKGDFGFNARTDKYENLFAAGVIDPTKVAA